MLARVREYIRNALLRLLHQAHPGIPRMKGLARSYMWWPNMDAEVEALVKACVACQESRSSSPVAPLHPWEFPDKPWRRIHMDYAGPWSIHATLAQDRRGYQDQ